VNPDGTLCVGLPEELCLRFKGRFELKEYFEGPLRSYFIGTTHKLQGKPWPYGEWGHGAVGVREFYGNNIGSTDQRAITEFLALVAGDAAKGHWVCPRGCGTELRRYHLRMAKELQGTLPREIVSRSLQLLKGDAP
jgi:hypothetical protein